MNNWDMCAFEEFVWVLVGVWVAAWKFMALLNTSMVWLEPAL